MRLGLNWVRWVAGGLLVTAALQGFLLSDFKFSREINIVDVATGGLTLFLAFYIPSRLDRRLSSQRYELEILIRGVERAQSEFTSVWDAVQAGSQPISAEVEAAIIRSFTNLSHSLNTLSELSKECGLPALGTPIVELEKQRRQFKWLVTGNGFQQTPQFYYTAEQIAAVRQDYFRINLACSRLIIQINRMHL